MRKLITMLYLVVMSTVFIAGCSSLKNSDDLYLSNCTDDMFGMGKKYFVNNLKEGDYEIEFTAKEYEYGVLKEEHILYKSTIEHNGNNSTLKIGVVDEESDSSLKVIINDSEFGSYTLNSVKNGYDTGIAMSILDKDKYFNLDSEVVIAVYSIGGENRNTEGLNIDGEFEIGNNNLNDLVVYMKLHKVN